MNIKRFFSGYSLSKFDRLKKVINVSPGPGQINSRVINQINDSLKNKNLHGITPLEISHRSPQFQIIQERTEKNIRRFMKIPEDFSLLWTQGGGHGQFAAIPLNLKKIFTNKKPHYIVNGTWSHRSAIEASKILDINETHSYKNMNPLLYNTIPKFEINSNTSYVYICSNETVNGTGHTENKYPLPNREQLNGAKLVVDMSSDFGTKIVDWSKIDVAFACSSKNLGTAGSNLLIVKKDILQELMYTKAYIPSILDWNLYETSNSLYNTPAIFNIFVTDLVFQDYIEKYGDINLLDSINYKKAFNILKSIENNPKLELCIKDEKIRSIINIPFWVDNIKKFTQHCYINNLVGVRTKTPFDWNTMNTKEPLRISLYNGVTTNDCKIIYEILNDY